VRDGAGRLLDRFGLLPGLDLDSFRALERASGLVIDAGEQLFFDFFPAEQLHDL